MNRLTKVRFYFLVLVLIIATLSAGACGSSPNATPQLVNTASAPTSIPTSAPVSTTKAVPTAKVEQPTKAVPTNTPLPADTPTPTGPQVFKVGDVVKINDSVLVVLGWGEVTGDSFSKPDAGSKFIGVDVLLVNTGASPVSVSSMLQLTLKDDTGQQYDVDLSASVAAKKDGVDGELLPGERVRGLAAFQVPEQAKGLQFVFDASVFGTGKAFVDLGDKPVSNEPPTKIEGETEQPIFKIGETVKIGAFEMTVNQVTSPKGDSFNKPSAGNKFLIVDVTLENKGTKAENVSSSLQMWLKDPTGQRYKDDLSAIVASKGKTPDGEIAAGEKIRGQVGFQVPEEITGLVFVFDEDLFGEGKVSVALP